MTSGNKRKITAGQIRVMARHPAHGTAGPKFPACHVQEATCSSPVSPFLFIGAAVLEDAGDGPRAAVLADADDAPNGAVLADGPNGEAAVCKQ